MVRINTGAPLPPGADAVVMVEDTKLVSANRYTYMISSFFYFTNTSGWYW